MNKHEANNAFEQQISNEKLARHNQLIAEEAKACNAPLDQYKLGHALHVGIEAQAKAAEKRAKMDALASGLRAVLDMADEMGMPRDVALGKFSAKNNVSREDLQTIIEAYKL